ncbi:hypothetical protein ABE42_00590 [Bacillus thuringiensis]|uniref:Uncharacterized protein n=2 Tax=Bacillus cereus TaxID=1396 RepID=A0A150BTX2_BACCE|nr:MULTISPECIES: hypothetical protein [Bacillus cereus group]EEM44129.1 hypothetical protein bthur0005_61770 [Bacillus thuringiensis serovar pakistani str. T13001]EJR59600.1 hypothetical protein IK5_06237 [Bacillus cereus VD154]KXY29410.1 hypothetical protein AT267_14450 [Bacillus cereus]MBG9484661.1 hypothetical protein [Bacillus thuringiensis]MBG9523368.1 hypothetical protein [Bacillus thuringiensis]
MNSLKQTKVLYSVIGVLLVVVGVMVGIIVAKSGDSSPVQQVTKQEEEHTSQKKEQKKKITAEDVKIVEHRTKEYLDPYLFKEGHKVSDEMVREIQRKYLTKRVQEELLPKYAYLADWRATTKEGNIQTFQVLDAYSQIDQTNQTITTYVKYSKPADVYGQTVDIEFWIEWIEENKEWRINSSLNWINHSTGEMLPEAKPISDNKRNILKGGREIRFPINH